jgi:hypothetical protein
MLRVAFEAEILVLSAAAPFTTREERERGLPSVLPQLWDPKPRYRPDLQQVQLSTQGCRRAEVQGHDDDEPAASSPASGTGATGGCGATPHQPASGAARNGGPPPIGDRAVGLQVKGHDGGGRVSAPRYAWRSSVAACCVAPRSLWCPSARPTPIRPRSLGESPSARSVWRTRAEPPLWNRRLAGSSCRVRSGWRAVAIRGHGHRSKRTSGYAGGLARWSDGRR